MQLFRPDTNGILVMFCGKGERWQGGVCTMLVSPSILDVKNLAKFSFMRRYIQSIMFVSIPDCGYSCLGTGRGNWCNYSFYEFLTRSSFSASGTQIFAFSSGSAETLQMNAFVYALQGAHTNMKCVITLQRLTIMVLTRPKRSPAKSCIAFTSSKMTLAAQAHHDGGASPSKV
ncbi:hypothetical protein ABKN59_006755 [Abortiporus biennis]